MRCFYLAVKYYLFHYSSSSKCKYLRYLLTSKSLVERHHPSSPPCNALGSWCILHFACILYMLLRMLIHVQLYELLTWIEHLEKPLFCENRDSGFMIPVLCTSFCPSLWGTSRSTLVYRCVTKFWDYIMVIK